MPHIPEHEGDFLQDFASMFDTETEQFIVGDERRFTGFLEEKFAQADEVEQAGQSGFAAGQDSVAAQLAEASEEAASLFGTTQSGAPIGSSDEEILAALQGRIQAREETPIQFEPGVTTDPFRIAEVGTSIAFPIEAAAGGLLGLGLEKAGEATGIPGLGTAGFILGDILGGAGVGSLGAAGRIPTRVVAPIARPRPAGGLGAARRSAAFRGEALPGGVEGVTERAAAVAGTGVRGAQEAVGGAARGVVRAADEAALQLQGRPVAAAAGPEDLPPITGATDEGFASRPPPPVRDGRAGGSGPPRQSNRPTADAGLPEDQRTAVFRPAPTIPAAEDPLVQRVAQAVRDTKPATQESLQALARGRARQIGRAGAGARTAETFGEVGPAATRRMGGEIARPEFESIAQLFTPEEAETLLSRIWGRGSVLEFANAQPGQINFRQLNADRAFKKLFNPDSATLPTPFELELLERVYGPELVRAVLSKKRLGQRAWDGFLDVWNLPRSLLATGDISATIRQAGVLGPGNPIEFKNAFRDQIKAFGSEKFALASREAIEADPDFIRFTTKSGRPEAVGSRADRRLHISSIGEAADRSRREEQFMTSLAGRLPIVRNSERAFVTMLNELRFSVMKKMIRHVELASGGPATDVQLDRIADFINYATGRGSLGKAEAAAPLLNGLGFSPRLAISRFQLPLPLFTRAPNVRKKFAQDLVTYAGTGAMIMFLLDQNVPGVDVIRDPRSSDFGKVKLGKTRLDLFAGNLQTARFVFGLASGERQSAGTRSVAGQNRFDTVARFLRTKAHPSLGLVLDVASEEDFLGEEFSLDPERFTEADLRRNPALRTFTPLLIQDIIEAWKESGPLEAGVAGVASLLGAGAITFATADDASQELWGQPITEVWPFQQGLAKDLHARTSDRGPSAFDQSDINHYAAFQDILQQLRDGAIDKRTAVNRYFSINSFYSGLREGLSAGIFGGDLTEEPVFPVAPSGGTPEQQAALQEYFDSQAPFETPSGFDSAEWRKTLKVLESKWGREDTLEYVLANTHLRPIPSELLDLLPDNTRGDIQRSSDARAAHLEATDVEVPAIPLTEDAPAVPAVPVARTPIPASRSQIAGPEGVRPITEPVR